MTRRHISARERADIFTRNLGRCHISGTKIDAGYEPWQVEHVIPLKMGGDDHGHNLQPAHFHCHMMKTGQDIGHVAKAKRMQQRAIGVKRQPRQIMPGARASGWRKPLHGPAVRREGE